MALEWFLQTATDNILGYVLDQSGIGERLRSKLAQASTQAAFKRALRKAFQHFQEQHPQWAASLFDISFFEHEGKPLLEAFLLPNGRPDPSEMAKRWAASLDTRSTGQLTTRVRELEPVVADFIEDLHQALKTEPALQDLYASQAAERTDNNIEDIARNIRAIRYNIEHDKATPGTHHDYLHWLIERYLYLDTRGTHGTQQVQVKLEDVYISLKAQQEGIADPEALSTWGANLGETLRDPHLTRGSLPDKIIELAQAVENQDHLVILGQPGSGKTTLLHYLALKHAQALWTNQPKADSNLGKARFPIHVRIADYAEHGLPKGLSLSEFLANDCCRHECPKAGLSDLLETALHEGNCLILLDGLDEIVKSDDRLAVAQQIEDFVRRHDDVPNRFVITSRIAGYVRLNGKFAHYTVQDMDEQQIRSFLEVWCSAVEAAQAPHLSQEARASRAKHEIDNIMQAVQDTPGVRRLATNPLLLRMLALIHRTNAQLPQRRIELYEKAAETLARTWRTAHGVPESALVERSLLTSLLGEIAYWLHTHKPTGIANESEVYRVLGREWARLRGLPWDEDHPDIQNEIEKFLQRVRLHTGLFVETTPRQYKFMHLTFQEYYVARRLVARSRTRATLIREHLHDPRWNEPILLALGYVGQYMSSDDSTELLETAILAHSEEARELGFTPSKYEDLLGRDYLFALRCLGDQIPVHGSTIHKLMTRLANELLHETGSARHWHYRKEIDEKLEYLKGSPAASILATLLTPALSDPDPDVSRRAALGLIQLGETLHKQELAAALLRSLHHTDPIVRVETAENLLQLEQVSSDALEALLDALHDDDYLLRYAASEAALHFARISNEITTRLLDSLHNENPAIRLQTVRGIRDLIGSEEGYQQYRLLANELTVLLHDDNDVKVRCEAAQVLPVMLEEEFSQDTKGALFNALHDQDPRVRCEAAKTLWLQGITSPEIEATVLPILQDGHLPVNTRRRAAVSLKFLIFKHPQLNISDRVIDGLLNALNDADLLVRDQAIQALGKLKPVPPKVTSALLNLLKKDRGMRYIIAKKIAELGVFVDQLVPLLLQDLHNNDAGTRYRAANFLVELGEITDDVIHILTEALQKSGNWSIRYDAALLLGSRGTGNEQTVQTLLDGLRDNTHNVREACVTALIQLGQRFPDLQSTLEEKLTEALQKPEFTGTVKPTVHFQHKRYDDYRDRSAFDYAFDALWSLVVKNETDES